MTRGGGWTHSLIVNSKLKPHTQNNLAVVRRSVKFQGLFWGLPGKILQLVLRFDVLVHVLEYNVPENTSGCGFIYTYSCI